MTLRGIAFLPMLHPRFVLIGAAVVGVLALLSAMRLTPNVSLSAMLADDAPSAAAMHTIATQFRAMDELLLVASVATDARITDEQARRRLLAFARRMEKRAADSAELNAMIARISFGIGDDAPERRFVREVVAPNMLLYVDADRFELAIDRLSPASMRQQISHNEAMIAAPGPAAGSLARQLLRDPLRLREMIAISQFVPQGGDDEFFSSDGRSLLIRISGAEPSGNLAFTSDLLEVVQDAAEDVNEDGLVLEYAGAYAIAAASHRAIRSDMIRSVVGSLVLIQLFLLIVYRRLLSFVLAIAPVALAIVTAFGMFALISTHVTPVTAVIGAVLAGLGIDYCVHVLSHYERHRGEGAVPIDAARCAMRSVGPRTTAAATTTLIGFLAISLSQVNALREFSILGAFGLAAALGASLTVLPAMLVMSDRRIRKNLQSRRLSVMDGIMSLILAHRSICVAATAVLFAVCAIVLLTRPGGGVAFEADLTSMHPQPNPALALQSRIGREFAHGGETLLLHMQAESPEAIVALSHEIASCLKQPQVRDVGVVGFFSLATLLPEAQQATSRQTTLQDIDPERVVHDFEAALRESIFDVDAYAEYAVYLRELVRPRVPSLDDLHRYPPLSGSLLPHETRGDTGHVNQAIAVLSLEHAPVDRGERDRIIETVRDALGDLPEGAVTLTGLSVVGHDTEVTIRRDLAVLLLVAAVAVMGFLLAIFRRPTDAALTLLPALFGLACLLAVMNVVPGGQGFNMINLIALPLLCGIGVDDGIFMTTIARRHRGATPTELAKHMLASSHAVIVTSVTTMLAFGSLLFTSTPAIQSLGWMTAVGVGACLIGTLGLLAPLLLIRSTKAASA